MAIDPSLGRPLLEPLLRFQQSSLYQINFAAADMGTAYPNATAANNMHNQGIERAFRYAVWVFKIVIFLIESANMIIMAYALARTNGVARVVNQHVSAVFSTRIGVHLLTAVYSTCSSKIGPAIL
jgi:hypothetical protein